MVVGIIGGGETTGLVGGHVTGREGGVLGLNSAVYMVR